MDLHDTLLAYSEWLDSEGLIVSDNSESERKKIERALAGQKVEFTGGASFRIDPITAALLADVVIEDRKKDTRSHDILASMFIKEWENDPNKAVLAGRGPVEGQAAADLSADALGLSPVEDFRSLRHRAQNLALSRIAAHRKEEVSNALRQCAADSVSNVPEDRLEEFIGLLTQEPPLDPARP